MSTAGQPALQSSITVGVLALQGAFLEHLVLLKQATSQLNPSEGTRWRFIEVRNPEELSQCDALIIPGGESTTMALVAASSGLMEPLRHFVKVQRRPTWGTCAGLIMLAESANRIKQGGQDLIGGLDVRVNRNHFGRQTESFEIDLHLPLLESSDPSDSPFRGIFIRAPVVEKVLPIVQGEQVNEAKQNDRVIAPSRTAEGDFALKQVNAPVEIMARLPDRTRTLPSGIQEQLQVDSEAGDIVAVRQGNVFGTSFHPELTRDARIHIWWLNGVKTAILERRVR